MSTSGQADATPRQIFTLIGALLGVCALGGALIAGIAMPFAATTGTSINALTSMFEDSPRDLGFVEPSEQSVILAADGTEIATFYAENRLVVSSSNISEYMKQAVVAIEDRRFYEHHGIDAQGLMGAFINNISGGATSGGSSITQQYVKNALIERGRNTNDNQLIEQATERTITRKLNEARLAVAVEKTMTKDEILTGYLNLAQFGPASYGVESSAQYYFSKSAKELTIEEAAMLAGITQSPAKWNPVTHPEAAKERRDTVISVMEREGYITAEQRDAAMAVPIESMLKISNNTNGCAAAGISAHFCELVVQELLQNEKWGADREERVKKLYRGGLIIRSTLDPAKQKAAYDSLVSNVPVNDPSGIKTAISSVEPGTGHILAMTQNTNYGNPSEADPGATKVNLNVGTNLGGGAGFQSGSTFKIFTLIQWLKTGHSPYEVVNSNEGTIPRNQWKALCNSRNFAVDYSFHNLEGIGGGPMTVLEATRKSVNGAFPRMAQQMSLCDIGDTALSMGVERGNGTPWEYNPAMVLGSNTITPLSMATAVATLSAEGKHCKPMSFTEVTDTQGTTILNREPECDQALDKEIARETTQVLKEVVKGNATGYRAAVPGREVAGKTGTSNKDQNAWFVGYTPQLATAVWQGHQEGSISMFNAVINGRRYSEVYGGLFPAMIFSQYTTAALANQPAIPFAQPNKSVVNDPPPTRQNSQENEETSPEQEGEEHEESEEGTENNSP